MSESKASLPLEVQFTLKTVEDAMDKMSHAQLLENAKKLARLHLSYQQTVKELLRVKSPFF